MLTWNELQSGDWSRYGDDYAPGDADWMDVTRVGSAYHEQIDSNRSGHQRHRKIDGYGAWVAGPAPQ